MPTEELFGNYNIKADPVDPSLTSGIRPADILPRLRMGEVSGFEASPIDIVIDNVLTKLDGWAASLGPDEQTVLATLLGATNDGPLSDGWPGAATILDQE